MGKKRIIFFKILHPSIYILCFSIRTIGRNIRDMPRTIDQTNIEDIIFAPLFIIDYCYSLIEIFIAIFIIFQEISYSGPNDPTNFDEDRRK